MREPVFLRRRPRWPHFDERGPDHYYDDDPWDGRGYSGWSGAAPGRAPTGYHNESDIYEDEFDRRDRFRPRYDEPDYDRWPEDDFYDNRLGLYREPGSYDFQRGPGHWWRPRRERLPFPEDRHEHTFGRNIHDRNTNRGRPAGRRRFAY